MDHTGTSGIQPGKAAGRHGRPEWPDGAQVNITTRNIPTGGGFLFNITDVVGPTLTITREDNTGVVTTVYDGSPLGVFLDVGENIPSALQPNITYTYVFTDEDGPNQIAMSFPQVIVTPQVDNMTYLWIRLIRGAMQNMQLPPGIQAAEVLQNVPVSKSVKLPAVFINQDLVQQANVPIGRNFGIQPEQDDDTDVITSLVMRRFSIWIQAMDSTTTNFYHDVIIGLMVSIMTHIFGEDGIENSINYSFQSTGGMAFTRENSPTFYYSQIYIDFTGPLNITLTYTPIGITKEITPTIYPETSS